MRGATRADSFGRARNASTSADSQPAVTLHVIVQEQRELPRARLGGPVAVAQEAEIVAVAQIGRVGDARRQRRGAIRGRVVGEDDLIRNRRVRAALDRAAGIRPSAANY